MSILSIDNEIRILTNQHANLEHKIANLIDNPAWDEFAVENLKKQKLQIKDKLSTLYRKRYEELQIVNIDDH